MITFNDPTIIAEITSLHDAYEHALVANDVAVLSGSFWTSPHAVRFGVSEHLYGAEAIADYRNDSPPVLANRRLTRRTINTFGPDTAIVMCELTQTVGGQPRHGRQSQVWIRFPEVGWKIVSAHVSNALITPASVWSTYVDRAAAAVGVPLDPAHRSGVVENLQRAATLASALLTFELPADTELAPVFTP
jgi:hypothetical protein